MSTVNYFHSTLAFYDDRNFPYGFQLSGYFTRTQAELLQSSGRTLQALDKGWIKPSNPEQDLFIEMCQGNRPAQTDIEKAWSAYHHAISKRNTVLKTA
ncbi:MAG: hypothetical protein ACJA0E_002065 [Bermanella sp.]|jgi:uncharacterized protein YifE (UPF0438 family)